MTEKFVEVTPDKVQRAQIILDTAHKFPTEFTATQLGKTREVVVAYYGGCKGVNSNAYGADAIGPTGSFVEIKTTIPWKSGTIAFNYGPISEKKRLKLSECEHLLAVFTLEQKLESIYLLLGDEWDEATRGSKAKKNMKLTLKKAIQYGARRIWSMKQSSTMNMTVLNTIGTKKANMTTLNTNGTWKKSTIIQMTIDNLIPSW